MKLDIFQSSHGDCLLLESRDGKRILCDGGTRRSMGEFVAPALDKLRKVEPERPIGLAYVSHIDGDHIGGILKLLEDEVEWRVFEKHPKTNPSDANAFAEPDLPRAPRIDNIWHNAFRDQVDHEGAIEDLLAAAAPVMAATQSAVGIQAAFEMQQISLGVEHALRVSKLVAPQVLGIPLNAVNGAAPAKLLMARPGQKPIRLGSLEITIVGPTEAELSKLRAGWNNWLERSSEKVKSINREIKRIVEEFAASSEPQPLALFNWEGIPGFRNVTVPNLASLVLFIREGDRTLLMTGDAQQDLLLDQLAAAGLLKDGHLHLDALKVQHHGSEHNMSPKFAQAVSADNYIFCGDGLNGNPEPEVIRQIFDSRVSGNPAIRALAPQAQDDRPFSFWFSTSSETPPESAKARANFLKVEAEMRKLEKRSGERLTTHFNTKETSIVLQL